jgi:uncharacterized protein (TIGR04255 family)
MPRPLDLPDFGAPPLNEVILGVQFAPISGYSAVDTHAIWELFRRDFPKVEEQPPLAPQFETFGGGGASQSLQFQFGPALPPMRLWFVSESQDRLLQFQPDRFLINWRQSAGVGKYPRYEKILETFETCLNKLRKHLRSEKNCNIDINQIEISYVNLIPVDEISNQSNWLRMWQSIEFPIERLNATFSEVIKDGNDKPIARLHHEFASLSSLDGKGTAIRLNLTYRGKPSAGGVDEAIDMLGQGRLAIVNRFTELTTEFAHSAWKRKV